MDKDLTLEGVFPRSSVPPHDAANTARLTQKAVQVRMA